MALYYMYSAAFSISICCDFIVYYALDTIMHCNVSYEVRNWDYSFGCTKVIYGYQVSLRGAAENCTRDQLL